MDNIQKVGLVVVPAVVAIVLVVVVGNFYSLYSENNMCEKWLNEIYRRSTDGGVNFDPTENLSNNVGVSFDPAISTFGNNVYVIWSDDSPGNFDILFKRSLDSGSSFSADSMNLSNSEGFSFHSSISASDNSVYVVWEDHTPEEPDILFKSSSTAGTTFDRTTNLSNNAGQSFSPTISFTAL